MMLVGPSENAERKSQSLACERLLNERASTIDAPDLPSSGQSVAYAKPTLSARDEERLISLMSDTHLSVLGADSPGALRDGEFHTQALCQSSVFFRCRCRLRDDSIAFSATPRN
eukprot:scaffold182240_cov33-Tisochrysis_lutea.AAC.4